MPRPKSPRPRVRLNLEIPQETRDRLARLQIQMEADNITEVVRRLALRCESLLEIADQGRLVLRRKDGTEAELILL